MSKFEKMEQALDEIGNACAWIAENCNDEQTAKYMLDLVEKVKAALEEPKRNCDVGTEEQERRFRKYCTEECNRYRCGYGSSKSVCIDRCAIAWSQMPYEATKGYV